MSKWNKKENMAWLRARGLKTGGDANTVRQRVKDCVDSNDIPELIMIKMCGKETLLTMIRAMKSLICCCMTVSDKEGDVEYLELVIRYFLIMYDEFKGSISDSTVGWVKAYNFLSLLNLPDIVKRYGSMRVLWEGGEDGEGYLKGVKSELRGGLVRQ